MSAFIGRLCCKVDPGVSVGCWSGLPAFSHRFSSQLFEGIDSTDISDDNSSAGLEKGMGTASAVAAQLVLFATRSRQCVYY